MPHVSKGMLHLSFSVWLFSLSTMSSLSLCIHTSFFCHLVVHYLGYCGQCCNAHRSVGIFTRWQLCSLGYIPRGGMARPCGSCVFHFFGNLHTVVHNGCTLTSASSEQGSLCPHSYQMFALACLSVNGHPSRCAIPCGFAFHLLIMSDA